MPRKDKRKGGGPNERRAQHPPRMSTAPHQTRSFGRLEEERQFVLDRQHGDGPPRRRQRSRLRGRKKVELPPELFPVAQGSGLGRLLAVVLIPALAFVLGYAAVNAGTKMVENGVIEPGGVPHSVLCTAVDIAVTAGFGFQGQFARAQCNGTFATGDPAAHDDEASNQEE